MKQIVDTNAMLLCLSKKSNLVFNEQKENSFKVVFSNHFLEGVTEHDFSRYRIGEKNLVTILNDQTNKNINSLS